jgi:cytochrome c oxidase cbb3-type subunit 3
MGGTMRTPLAAQCAGIAAILLAPFCALSPAFPQQHAGQYEIADIEHGARLFAERCVACHGPEGDLLPQANLRSGTFVRDAMDFTLINILRDGIDGTAMAPTGYGEAEITALVAYLKNMTTWDVTASGLTLGDPARGEALFNGRGRCLDCHSTGPDGPKFAPSLSDVGSRRTAATIRRTLIDPGAAMLPINRPVRAVTPDGRVINGRRLNEDTFSVQLVTEDGELVSLDKSSLAEYTVGDATAMRNYGDIFSDDEIADLLAYLLTLRGLNR